MDTRGNRIIQWTVLVYLKDLDIVESFNSLQSPEKLLGAGHGIMIHDYKEHLSRWIPMESIHYIDFKEEEQWLTPK